MGTLWEPFLEKERQRSKWMSSGEEELAKEEKILFWGREIEKVCWRQSPRLLLFELKQKISYLSWYVFLVNFVSNAFSLIFFFIFLLFFLPLSLVVFSLLSFSRSFYLALDFYICSLLTLPVLLFFTFSVVFFTFEKKKKIFLFSNFPFSFFSRGKLVKIVQNCKRKLSIRQNSRLSSLCEEPEARILRVRLLLCM